MMLVAIVAVSVVDVEGCSSCGGEVMIVVVAMAIAMSGDVMMAVEDCGGGGSGDSRGVRVVMTVVVRS